MTPAELQQCRERALLAAATLRLPLRSRVWRGQAGEFAGSGIGSSLDFQDHRAYAPGDDPRHINWQAYARSGQYTMKLYREEVRPVIDIIFDVSPSMFFTPEKAHRSAELFYFLAESTRAAGASAALFLVKGDATRLLDSESVTHHGWWEIAQSLPAADATAPPKLEHLPLRANAIRVLISDLLFEGDPEPLLRTLTQRHGVCIALAPFVQAEADPGWEGNYEFVDAERNSHHPHRIEPQVLRRYKDAYARHFAVWKESARRHQTSLARVSADHDLTAALLAEAVKTGALEAG